MKWIRYEQSGRIAYGIVEGDRVREASGSPFASYELTDRRVALASVRVLVPVIPPTFYCCGLNYATHLRRVAAREGKEAMMPAATDIIGYRAQSALAADGDPIVIPRSSSGKVQYEGELVVVIGRKARRVTLDDALSCVFGYTIGNDVSERVWQRQDRTFLRSKNSDTFKPMGPWIETDVDLNGLITTVRLNGKEVSRFATNDMICGVAEAISVISENATLHPGDVIWMGTDEPTLDMVAGDEVEVAISGIGVLRNRVVADR